jgi:Ni/Fe-hydrogenase subunit HybB-like protein
MVGRVISKITIWRLIVAAIFGAGLYATYARFALGFSQATQLTDPQPWGLWVGLGTLCGVGLSAGGLGIAAAVYLLGFERYRPVLRTAVLVSFLGYMSVIAGMMYELGLPWRIWHPIFMWNRHSMLFEVSWCVMLYSTVLTLEFSPALVEKIPWKGVRAWYLKQQHRILIGLVLVGCVLSSLHQSFLGGLYLLTKGKLDPLWYTPYLTTLFYLSAIPAGLAVTVMALYLCVRSLNVKLDTRILSELGGVISANAGAVRNFPRSGSHDTRCAAVSVRVAGGDPVVLGGGRFAGGGAADSAERGQGAQHAPVPVLDLQPDRDGTYG